MTFTIDLDKKQANQFHDIVAHALQSLTYQEATLKDAIEGYLAAGIEQKSEKEMSQQEFDNITNYLKDVTEKRLFLADVLASFLKTVEESTPKPIESVIVPAVKRNSFDDARERKEWVDSVIKDFAE